MAPNNKQVSDIMNDIYGNFWKKWRDKKNLTDSEWDELIGEVAAYGRKYEKFRKTKVADNESGLLVSNLLLFFLEIIEERETEGKKVNVNS